jgi:hypothetical protein
MTLDTFIGIQEQLFWAFGWFARWWLILFGVGGMALATFMLYQHGWNVTTTSHLKSNRKEYALCPSA